MIVKKDFCIITEAAGMAELVDLENIVDARCVVAQKLAWHVATGALFNIFAILLADPAHPANVPIKNGGKFGATKASDVDILPTPAGNRQNLVNGQIRMLAPIALVAC